MYIYIYIFVSCCCLSNHITINGEYHGSQSLLMANIIINGDYF